MRTAMRTDWTTYADVYPERYMSYSVFDEKVYEELINTCSTHLRLILDIGCGHKCSVQHYMGGYPLSPIRVDVLDPIWETHSPDWAYRHTHWGYPDMAQGYDMVILRNSLNYLSPVHIEKLPSFLVTGGVLMANTFLEPAQRLCRRYSSRMGDEGWELSYYESQTRRVHHTLLPDSATEPIEHSFQYYSLDQLAGLLGNVEFMVMDHTVIIKKHA